MRRRIFLWLIGIAVTILARTAVEFLLYVGFPPGSIYWLLALMFGAWAMDQFEVWAGWGGTPSGRTG